MPRDDEAIIVRFQAIDDKLGEMHSDFKRLEARVMNGLTERIVEVEKQIAVSESDRTRKERTMMIWQTAIISAIVMLCVALGGYVVTEYVKHQEMRHNTTHQTQ